MNTRLLELVCISLALQITACDENDASSSGTTDLDESTTTSTDSADPTDATGETEEVPLRSPGGSQAELIEDTSEPPPATEATAEDGGTCAGLGYEAEIVPLDIHLMLDRSLSMNDAASGQSTKWEAIKSAVKSFVEDSASEGIGVGLHYFPDNATCTSDDDCGDSYCYLNVCKNTLDFTPCRDANDCPGTASDTCVPLGNCGPDSCREIGAACEVPTDDNPGPISIPRTPDAGTSTTTDAGGSEGDVSVDAAVTVSGLSTTDGGAPGDAGTTRVCEAVAESVCVTEDTCGLDGYVEPSVAIARLPDARDALLESLEGHEPVPLPFGLTPTGPALEGALAYSKDWAAEHPTHRVITVLATDGSPTQCAPSGTAAVAALAAVGAGTTPRVQTYTIGVFSATDDEGPENLQAVAREGDGEAFIIDEADDVAKRFIEALDSIRGAGLTCEFRVPEAEDGKELDYTQVNVELHEEDEVTRLPFVDSPADCGEEGGWYYDVNPDTGATPQKILACETSCQAFEQSRMGRIEIRVGCATYRLKPPRIAK